MMSKFKKTALDPLSTLRLAISTTIKSLARNKTSSNQTVLVADPQVKVDEPETLSQHQQFEAEEPSQAKTSDQEAWKRRAFHEAGHAVVNYLYGLGLEEVTISDTGGTTVRRRQVPWSAYVQTLCAGEVGELMATQPITSEMRYAAKEHPIGDRFAVKPALQHFCQEECNRTGTDKTASEVDEWCDNYYEKIKAEVNDLLYKPSNHLAVHRISEALLTAPAESNSTRRISGDEAERIIHECKVTIY